MGWQDVDYDALIPNNVGLADDPKLQRALEKWHPGYIDWWDSLPDGRNHASPSQPSGAQEPQDRLAARLAPRRMSVPPVVGLHPLEEGALDERPHVAGGELGVGYVE